MQCGGRSVVRAVQLHLEEARAGRSRADFFFARFTDPFDFQAQPQCDPAERVIAIQHHVFGVDLGHGVERIFGHVRVAAGGKCVAFKSHAFFQLRRKCRTFAQKHQALIEVAKGLFRLQLQLNPGPHAMTLQREFDLLEKIIAAHEELHWLVQYIEYFAERVFQRPGECNDTL